jgi:DNA-binding CsgD family transcriptional regulator
LVITRPNSTLPELTAMWRHEDRLEPLVATLEAKGFIRQDDDDLPGYRAVDPDLALETPLHDYEKQLRHARERVRQLAVAHRDRSNAGHTATLIEVVTGRRAVLQRLTQLQRGARVEICRLDKPPYVDGRAAAVDADALHPGIACRVIYEGASVEHSGGLRGVEQLIAAGQQARVLPTTLPMSLYIVDGRHAFLPLQRESASVESAIVVHSSALLDALTKLFEGLWQRALPLELPATREAPAPQRRRAQIDEHRLVALLLSGLTDDAIARQLGVGYRTVQRHIATLMTKLGAHTRFQAGLQAALEQRRGIEPVRRDAS